MATRLWFLLFVLLCVQGGSHNGKGEDHEVVHISYPDILMIGAMKAGTTSLTSLMRSNPAFCDYGEKEKVRRRREVWQLRNAVGLCCWLSRGLARWLPRICCYLFSRYSFPSNAAVPLLSN